MALDGVTVFLEAAEVWITDWNIHLLPVDDGDAES